ncbi:hypothetical protein N836_06320 [Leptolyngbya sp. Heron Island J]|nr:hypothetical protein N836_06320 [Leptolyngbya sp. Heron Island J]
MLAQLFKLDMAVKVWLGQFRALTLNYSKQFRHPHFSVLRYMGWPAINFCPHCHERFEDPF